MGWEDSMRHYGKFYVGGEWVDAQGTARHVLINPSDEKPLASVSMGNAEDVDRAVRAARTAFESFSATTTEERLNLLDRIVQQCTARQSELGRVLTDEMGSPIKATMQVTGAAEQFRQARKTLAAYQFERPFEGSIVRLEPIGVCGLITPWNWPLNQVASKVAPALATGCTVVLKPSELAPLSALALRADRARGRPAARRFNLVNGDGQTVGQAIAAHPEIDMVSFTGSTGAGIQVAKLAADTVKRVAQELGGKSANIILPSADIAAAARWSIARGFFNSGQSCQRSRIPTCCGRPIASAASGSRPIPARPSRCATPPRARSSATCPPWARPRRAAPSRPPTPRWPAWRKLLAKERAPSCASSST
jgi:aldehyde dehydrogenase (NAD+)